MGLLSYPQRKKALEIAPFGEPTGTELELFIGRFKAIESTEGYCNST